MIYWYAFALLLPYGQLSNTLSILVKYRFWTPINGLGAFGALCGLLGQAGILLAQIDGSDRITYMGFLVASVGTILLVGPMLWDTIIWPILVAHDERLLDFQGPIYRSRTFLPFFIVSGLVYGAGYIMVGIGIMETDLLPSTAGLLLAIGAPTFALGSMFGKLQVYPRSLGGDPAEHRPHLDRHRNDRLILRTGGSAGSRHIRIYGDAAPLPLDGTLLPENGAALLTNQRPCGSI